MVSEAANEEYLDRIVAACLRPLVGWTVAAFLIVTLIRFLSMDPGWPRDFTVYNGIATSTILLVLMWSLNRPWKGLHSGAIHASVLLILFTTAASFHHVLGIRNNYTGVVALVIVACGAVLLDSVWVVLTTSAVLALWVLATLETQHVLPWPDLPPFLAAGVVSFILFRHRRDFFNRQFALVESQVQVNDMLSQSLEEAQRAHREFESRVQQRAAALDTTQGQLRFAVAEKTRLQTLLKKMGEDSPLGRLAGGVAHDFANLITVIRGNLEALLYCDEVSDPEVTDMIREGLRETNEIDQLTKQLLAYGRKQTLTPEAVTADLLLYEFAAGLGALLPESTDLQLQMEAGPTEVVVDIPQLNQALMNLCLNAVEAMPDGGVLRLRSYVAGGRACFEVRDSGVGMKAETLSRARDPYYTEKGFHAGRGLGLSVVEGILKQHDGRLELHSNPGEGSTCTLRLPVFHSNCVDPKKVLLVEDEPTSRLLADRYLKRLGYEVISAETAMEARQLFLQESEHPGSLLVDVVLPDENGLALAVSLKKLCPSLRVIVTSAHTHNAVEGSGLDLKTPFLHKPYGLSDFREALESP